MKLTKKIIAVMMILAMFTALLTGCSFGKPNSGNTTNDANDDSSDAASSQVTSLSEGEEAISGTGDNSAVTLSMTLFDVEYILGESKVKDLHDNEWGYDADSWKDVDMDEKLEYGSYGDNGKKMDNNTTEITIGYKNLAETFATPENCVITQMEFEGTTDGTIAKAGVKILGGKVDLTTCTTTEKLEAALSEVLSSYTKESNDYTSFVSASYKFDVKNGYVYLHTTTDKETNSFEKVNTTLTYRAEENTDDDATGEKAGIVPTGKSEAMWDDGTTVATTGDSDKLTATMTIFGKEYTVGKTTLKDLIDDGWGYDTDDWKEIDMEKPIEYKYGYSYKKLHNNTAELTVNIGNYAAVTALPEDCIVTGMQLYGKPDGVFDKAELKLCGDIEPSKFTTFNDLDSALREATSWLEKRETSETMYSYHFLANDGNGSVVIDERIDKDKSIQSLTVELRISDQFTYEAAE